jgi:hypothetical protein
VQRRQSIQPTGSHDKVPRALCTDEVLASQFADGITAVRLRDVRLLSTAEPGKPERSQRHYPN